MNTQDKRAHAARTQPPPTAEATVSTTLRSRGTAGGGRIVAPALVGLRTSRERAWTPTETILYALGVGAGQRDPAAELRFTTENSTGHPQRVLPTFASVLAADPPPLGELTAIRHAEEALTLFRPLSPAGRVHTTAAVTALHDQGSGALVEHVSRLQTRRARSSAPYAGPCSSSAPADSAGAAPGPPAGSRRPTRPSTGSSPPSARTRRCSTGSAGTATRCTPIRPSPARAGLPRPILHGLCTFGFAGRLLLPLVGNDPTRVRHVRVRFAAPLHPGDTLTVHAWRRPYGVVFRATDGPGRVVLDRGVLAVSAR